VHYENPLSSLRRGRVRTPSGVVDCSSEADSENRLQQMHTKTDVVIICILVSLELIEGSECWSNRQPRARS
jgi:hypothetical protein